MNRALVYLLAMRLKNTVWSTLRRPSRMLGVVLLLGFLGLMALAPPAHGGPDAPGTREVVLQAVLALYLLLALFGGIGEPGLGFLPADLDYVLPAPFRRREVLAYHLARQYAQVLILGLLYVVFLGATRLPHPALAWVATVLCLVVAAHVQVASTLVATRVGDEVFGRLRRTSRVLLAVLLAAAAVVAIVGIAGAGDMPGLLTRVLDTSVARALLYPAFAAGKAAAAPGLAEAWPWLLGLAGAVTATFVLVLLFPVDLVETSVVTRAERKRRLTEGTPRLAGHRRPRGGRWGSQALIWLNALTLVRRSRMVLGLVAMLLVVLLVSGSRTPRTSPSSLPSVLAVLAFFPLIANLPLGFRGLRDHLEVLKTLPLAPTRLAAAQVAVPVAVIFTAQIAVLLVFFALGRLTPVWALAAVLALPVLDLGVVALVETFTLGRDPRQAGFLWTTLQMVAILVTLLPAVFAGALLWDLTGRAVAAFLAGWSIHLLVAIGLLRTLGWRFSRWEPTS